MSEYHFTTQLRQIVQGSINNWEFYMNIVTKMLSAGVGLTMSAGIALAEPAIIFDLGGKFDKSFNESAFTGAQRWADETGGSFREIELQNEAQRERHWLQ